MSVYREPRASSTSAVRFADLAPATRARLTASCRGDAVPVPLLRSTFKLQGRPWLYLSLAALLIALAAGVALATVDPIWEGAPSRGAFDLFTALVTIALGLTGLAWRSRRLRGGLPFPAGDHLFARDLVMARRGWLTVIPTRSLTLVQESPGRVAVLGPSRERIAVFACRREGVADELLTDRAALDRAEQAGDMAARLRLDPFVDEHPVWAESVRMEAPHGSWLESFPRFALALGALMALAAFAVPPLAMRGVVVVARRQIERAEADGDKSALTSFLSRHREVSPSVAEAADRALFAMAVRLPYADGLLEYLEQGGARAVVASEEVDRRHGHELAFSQLACLARWGRGPVQVEADARVLRLAIASEREMDLIDYISYGARRDEVRRQILPRYQLDRAVRNQNLEALRTLKARWDDTTGVFDPQTSPLPPPGMQQELAQAIDTLIDQHRVHLRERTGHRTSLARAVHQAIGQTLTIAPAPGVTPHLFSSTRAALEQVIATYLPRSMLVLEKVNEPLPYYSPTFLGPPTIVLDLDPLIACPQLPCRRRLRLSFHDFGGTALPTQTLSFTDPAPGSGRTFKMAVDEALTAALLGDGPPRRR